MPLLNRRMFTVTLGGALVSSAFASTRAAPPGDWETTTPAEAGFAPEMAERLAAAVRAGEANGLHAVVAIRHGKLVFERYYEGRDRGKLPDFILGKVVLPAVVGT